MKVAAVARWGMLGAVGALGLAGLGCGASDDAKDTRAEQRQVKAAFDDVQQAFIDVNPRVICMHLTEAAQKEMLRFASASGSLSCETGIGRLARATRKSGVKQKRAYVLAVRVDGDVAIAKVRDASRAPVEMKVVREDGRWKLTSVLGGPIGSGG